MSGRLRQATHMAIGGRNLILTTSISPCDLLHCIFGKMDYVSNTAPAIHEYTLYAVMGTSYIIQNHVAPQKFFQGFDGLLMNLNL